MLTATIKKGSQSIRSWNSNKTTWQRMTRSSLAIAICVVLILHAKTSAFLGSNVFLIGTVAIYLFPKSTVGAQLANTIIAYVGFLLGLAWYNIFLHIGLLIPELGKRIFIFLAFISGAWLCGLVRSRFPAAYLGINFFMLVNIFGLVVAIEIETSQLNTFTDFFYVFTFGTVLSFLCVLLWPENTASNVEAALDKVLEGLHGLSQHDTLGLHAIQHEAYDTGFRFGQAKIDNIP